MPLNTTGLVIREQITGENDRIITVLTRKRGIIRAFVYGAKKMKSRMTSPTQLFAYSDFSISHRRDAYIIENAVPKEMFFGLRSDIEKLALAQYFAQLEEELAPADENAEEYLRLILNSLHLLIIGKRPALQIKTVFEMRILCLSGYMPDIAMCAGCGKFEDDKMFFNMKNANIFCRDCHSGLEEYEITPGMLHALRHICYCDHGKIFSFSVSDISLAKLSELSEKYLFTNITKKFKTLDFYYSIK